MKIIDIVQFNTEQAFVMNAIKPLLYKEYQAGQLLIGTNGLMYNCYAYQVDRYAKAFAGRTLEIPMADGSVKIADGQWWQSSYSLIERVLGLQIESVTMGTEEGLKDCYVFTSYGVDSVKWHAMKEKCNVQNMHLYLYYEYEQKLRGRK